MFFIYAILRNVLMSVSPSDPCFEMDNLPRAVLAVQSTSNDENWEVEPHRHRWGQLIYTVRGLLRCEVANGLWLVPPQCALWVPGGELHSTLGSAFCECLCLFIEPDAAQNLPTRCCTLFVAPLLRELLLQASRLTLMYDPLGPDGRLVAVLLDQLASAPVEKLHLPVADDRRIRQLMERLLENPADRSSQADWAQRVGMSERTLNRVVKQQMGMSFGEWRRQLHIVLALQRMAQGESVQSIALDLGYGGASGFITMFRKLMGSPPARYLANKANETDDAVGRTIKIPARYRPLIRNAGSISDRK
ncbi:AraC family transcriptional regulator [Jejubacter calystegiae]|uniref:AraC family transcriptional regulator n=2 Tax=Jejubacter calystegiae TaxID=2579935 RepID=A0A4P8YP67_9ENTR|nr:AraC family transcriptional regulator [Jejubacter calystegiae]